MNKLVDLAKEISRKNIENSKWLLPAGYDQIWDGRWTKNLLSFGEKFIGNIKGPDHLFQPARGSQGGNDLWTNIKSKELLVKHNIRAS